MRQRSRASSPLAVATLFAGTFACSALVDANAVQCNLDGDCVARGFPERRCVENVCIRTSALNDGDAGVEADAYVDPKWGCLGTVSWPPQDSTRQVLLRRRFLRLFGEIPVRQIDVRACQTLDVPCNSPTTTARTDDDGYLNISLPSGFRGFLTLEPPATFPEMMPYLYNISPPQYASEEPTRIVADPVRLVSASELNALLVQVESSVDPALGHIVGVVNDCQGNRAQGVTLRASMRDKKTIQYYGDDSQVPSVTAQETSVTGDAGFINMATGTITVDAIVNPLNRKMGTYNIIVKAGQVSTYKFTPAPGS